MKTTTELTVEFTDDNRNFVKVTGAATMDTAVAAADSFLEEHGLCVKNGGSFYGSEVEADEVQIFNVG